MQVLIFNEFYFMKKAPDIMSGAFVNLLYAKS